MRWRFRSDVVFRLKWVAPKDRGRVRFRDATRAANAQVQALAGAQVQRPTEAVRSTICAEVAEEEEEEEEYSEECAAVGFFRHSSLTPTEDCKVDDPREAERRGSNTLFFEAPPQRTPLDTDTVNAILIIIFIFI